MSFTAADARKLAEDATDIDGPVGKVETQRCLDAIKTAAQSGKRECYLDRTQHWDLVKRRLAKANFKITVTSLRAGDYIVASW